MNISSDVKEEEKNAQKYLKIRWEKEAIGEMKDQESIGKGKIALTISENH